MSITHIDLMLQGLLELTGASRATLRRDIPGDYAFPVTNEACLPGVSSLKEERTVDLKAQPVVHELRKGQQIVQDDCRTAFDDPAFHRMLEAYGGLAAQIVTPIFKAEELVAILSLHQLGAPRQWGDGEVTAAAQTAEHAAALL
jgi:GAF domain-containing protein